MNAENGLTREQASRLLEKYGPNAIPPEKHGRLAALARRLWGPVPWVLEITLVLTLVTRRYGDGAAIAFLLLFNAIIAAMQEGKARDAVDLLRKRVVVQAHVKRDGAWSVLPADQLVPEDVVHVGLGDVVPADINILAGSLEVDESVVTGESMARTVESQGCAYAGTTVVHGDATAVVTATGTKTTFGKTAELVRLAHTPGQLERLILLLVTALTGISAGIIGVIAIFAVHLGMTGVDIAVFAIMILLASVPIALPAAFTLSTTLGSLELAKRGALITRLSALEDAASMDVLCTDKTGTITKNQLAVEEAVPFDAFSSLQVAALAASASDRAGQEQIDLLVLDYASSVQAPQVARTSFTPFDPAKKWSAAQIVWNDRPAVVYKGAPDVLRRMTNARPERFDPEFQRLARSGSRVIAVAISQSGAMRIAGLIALADPPREDAAGIIRQLHASGVEVLMLTGDTASTAMHVASQVGVSPDRVHASIYPEEKLAIIERLQKAGRVVGMTGDGVNDAPALRKANIGIAVSTATDVAKAAAGIVLTEAGLSNVIAAVQSSRAVFERMLTYTTMKLVKYFEIVGVLTAGFFATKTFLLTPELMVSLLIFNDLVTLSISTDNVSSSQNVEAWRLGRMLVAALLIAVLTACSVLATVAFANHLFHPAIAQLRSVIFVALAAMGQIAVFAVRSRRAFFGIPPSKWLVMTSLIAVAGALAMALFGILTPALPITLIATVFGLLCISGCILAVLKLPVFAIARLGFEGIRPRS